MNTQLFDAQQLTDEELLAVIGGHGSPFTHKFTDAEWKALEARDHDYGLQNLRGSTNLG